MALRRLYKRGLKLVAVKPIRLTSTRVLNVGDAVDETVLRRYQIIRHYRRGLLGVVGDPWTLRMIEHWKFKRQGGALPRSFVASKAHFELKELRGGFYEIRRDGKVIEKKKFESEAHAQTRMHELQVGKPVLSPVAVGAAVNGGELGADDVVLSENGSAPSADADQSDLEDDAG